MKHRHLQSDVGYEPVAIEDILERGGPEDWDALRDAVIVDPFGDIAQAIVRICAQHYMYGTSILWTNIVRHLQEQARAN